MAAVNKDAKGWRIRFVDANGTRRTVRLSGIPKMNQARAEKIGRFIDDLNGAKCSGGPMDRQTAVWLADLGQTLHDKLSRAGLVEARKGRFVREFLADYIGTGERWKPATLILLNRTAENLNELFGDRHIQSITEADAAKFRNWLKSATGKKLSENTARRRCGHARQFFKAAIREGIIDRNPFADMSVAVGSARDKHRFVTEEECRAILEACPCHEWKLIFALARYGGLRCPSEVLALKWGDIDWQENRISISEPKVEHHSGRGRRIAPLFGEMRQILEDGFELAAEGTVHVVNRYRDASQNLRTTFLKILDRAGVERFERPFVNLRSSRATELRKRFDTRVVAQWLGHSETIAEKHYVQVREEDFAAAVAPPVAPLPCVAAGNNEKNPDDIPENIAEFAGFRQGSSDFHLTKWSQQDQNPDGKTRGKVPSPGNGGPASGPNGPDSDSAARYRQELAMHLEAARLALTHWRAEAGTEVEREKIDGLQGKLSRLMQAAEREPKAP